MTTEVHKLEVLTDRLLVLNNEAFNHFENYAKQKQNADFATYVKPFADDVKEASDQWLPLASVFVIKTKPKYLHDKQIQTAHENLTISSVTCFQADTKKKRFVEMNKSVRYTLELLKEAIEKNQ
ncbi:YppE family protein [Alteribacter populi]|uniref:YppE family protein n=1 Tax=Alteribacter populi TaxID=2011011 RepID=UPI000BBAF424|nr:YppE family protein [Alteribacter populi]